MPEATLKLPVANSKNFSSLAVSATLKRYSTLEEVQADQCAYFGVLDFLYIPNPKTHLLETLQLQEFTVTGQPSYFQFVLVPHPYTTHR